MDSVTHIVLGAVIGEAVAGKYIGRKALAIGAMAQSFPDIDIAAMLWSSVTDNLLIHRGITHSLLFALLCTLVFSFIFYRFGRWPQVSFARWALLIGIELAAHLALDSCTAYGTGLFEPFTHDRVSFHLLFVADPFFTFWTLVAAVALCFSLKPGLRKRWVRWSLAMSLVYFTISSVNKAIVSHEVNANLKTHQIAYERYFITPTPLNNWLWYVVAEVDSGYYIGYRSVFDHTSTMPFYFYPRQQQLLQTIRDHHSVEQLQQFSQRYYIVERDSGVLVFNDLRFGQSFGWSNPQSDFVFRYYLQSPDRNTLVVQQGRFSGWNRENLWSMIRRIKGV